MNEKLQMLLAAARRDGDLKRKLKLTRTLEKPYAEFCVIANEYGCPITVEELISCGQEYADNMLKSCNGGATYPFEYLDDAYELFFAALD